MEDEDDYWNTSETKEKALKEISFDNDVLTTREILAISKTSGPYQDETDMFAGAAKSPLLPLESLVSPKVLEIILQAQSKENNKKDTSEETVAVTLKRLILGRPYSLHCHRSLQSKTELLDGAISIGDGNAILTIVLYLIQTLNKKLVYEILSSRIVALNHYISFLQNEGKINELTDMLTMLGRSADAAMYQYQHYMKHTGSVDGLLRRINNINTNYFDQPGIDPHLTKMVGNYIKFLEWLKCTNDPQLATKSVLSCLAHCCLNHWNEGAGKMMSPMTLCQQQQIPPLQYDWVALNVHAREKNWDIVDSIFTKQDWLGRSTISTQIPIKTVIAKLSQLDADKKILANFINKVNNREERVQIATYFKVHSVVIEYYVRQKDRAALNAYIRCIDPQSEDYIMAKSTLSSSAIKWKN